MLEGIFGNRVRRTVDKNLALSQVLRAQDGPTDILNSGRIVTEENRKLTIGKVECHCS
jgi:hypothetical protein